MRKWRTLAPTCTFCSPRVSSLSLKHCWVKAQPIPRELMEWGQQHILLEAANDWAAKYFTFLMDTNPDSKMHWKLDTEVTQRKTFASGSSSEYKSSQTSVQTSPPDPSHILTRLNSLNVGSHSLGPLPALENPFGSVFLLPTRGI